MIRIPRRLLLLVVGSSLAVSGCATLFPDRKAEPPAPVVQPAPAPPIVIPPKPTPPPVIPPPPRSCVPRSLGPAPRYPDTDAALRAAPGAADRYQLLAAGRILRQQRLEDLERAIAACR
jgi:hypothetical protein